MANLFQSLIGKLGLSKSTVVDQAENVFEQNRDKIPDQFEGQIENVLHGDMLGGLLDKVGLDGEETPAAEVVPAEAEAEEVPAEEEASEEVTEEEATEEDATEEATEEETEKTSEDESEEEATNEEESK